MKFKAILSILLLALSGNTLIYSQSWKPKPVAGFKASTNYPGKPCQNILDFKDTSKVIDPCNLAADSCDSIIESTWNFGDGKKSKLKSPIHHFTTNGDFTLN